MDAFDQMRDMNVVGNIDSSNIDINHQQQTQNNHHLHYQQTNNYGIPDHLDNQSLHPHGTDHMHNVIGHIDSSSHHINELESSIGNENINNIIQPNITETVSGISDVNLPIESTVEKIKNFEKSDLVQHSNEQNLYDSVKLSDITDGKKEDSINEKNIRNSVETDFDDDVKEQKSNEDDDVNKEQNSDNKEQKEDEDDNDNEIEQNSEDANDGINKSVEENTKNNDDNETENEHDDCEAAAAPIDLDVSFEEASKTNGVTEVILMDEPAVGSDEEGVEDNQEDVLAGELADSEVANTFNVKPISNFVIKVKDETHRSDRKTSGPDSPLSDRQHDSKNRARSNTPIDGRKSNNKNSDDSMNTITTIKKGEEIDENRCRICLSKEDLVSIFKTENRQTLSDKIVTICTGVRIQRNDFLPQFICNTCMQSVQVAYNLKRLCEVTDKDLRSKLSRSKKSMRRPTEYVLLDATKFGESDESVDDEPSDDDEFKISNEEEIKSSEPDSDEVDSDFGSSKRRSRRVRSKKSTPKRSSKSKSFSRPGTYTIPSSSRPAPASVKRNRKSDSSVGRGANDNDFSSGSDDDFSPPKKRQYRSGNIKSNASKEGHCVYCNEIFPSQNALQKHKRIHAGEKPLICDMCGKNFKLLPSYQAHLAKHKEDGDTLMCTKCDKTFQKLADRRKHLIEEHNEKPETFPCAKCKRVFSLQKSLERHADEGKCPGQRKSASSSHPQRRIKSEMENLTLGRDLFKCVAPVTTTYWSDSFSD